MSEELTLESLGLKKQLDKMTVKELRVLVIEKMPMIVGATGMDKDELLSKIKDVLGIVEEEGAVSPYQKQISNTKREIAALRQEKAEVDERAKRDALRKKINKLKKRTRRLARAV